jgi:hypothetical protein
MGNPAVEEEEIARGALDRMESSGGDRGGGDGWTAMMVAAAVGVVTWSRLYDCTATHIFFASCSGIAPTRPDASGSPPACRSTARMRRSARLEKGGSMLGREGDGHLGEEERHAAGGEVASRDLKAAG